MNTTSQMEVEGINIAFDGDEKAKVYPHYPEGILPAHPETDPAKYEGSIDDITERLRFKVFQVWNSWSSLMTNETLTKKVKLDDKDSEDTTYIKACLVLFLDRLGKILGDTDIVKEMTREES